MKISKLFQIGVLASMTAFCIQGTCQESQIGTRTATDKEVSKAIDEVSGPKAVLQRIGIKPHVDAYEFFTDYNKSTRSKGQVSTDGLTADIGFDISNKHLVPLSMQDSVQVHGLVTVMLAELLNVTNSQVQVPLAHKVNWSYFLRQAQIIIDVDPKTGSPIASVIVGIQDLESNAFDSDMPIRDNEALRGLTRVRSAHGVQFVFNVPKQILDRLSVAVFNTGVGHPESMGDNLQPTSKGVTVLMSKKFSESLSANGAVTSIAYPAGTELRVNSGILYENKAGQYKLFVNHVYLPQKGNPLFPDAAGAWTIGAIKQLNESNSATVERTCVDHTFCENAAGVKHVFHGNGRSEKSLAAGVRRTSEGITRVEVRAAITGEGTR